MKYRLFTLLFFLVFIEGAAALIWSLSSPSEPGSARLFGYSYVRLGMAALILFILAILLWMLVDSIKRGKITTQIDSYLHGGDHLFFAQNGLWAVSVLLAGAFLFTWVALPTPLRPMTAWLSLVCLGGWVFLALGYREMYRQKGFRQRYAWLPRWSDLEPGQKRTALILLALGAFYLAAFIPANLHKIEGDEVVVFPALVNILVPGKTFAGTLYHIFIYEEYHYGYPFFAYSALVLLPVRLIYGVDFARHVQLDMLLIRELVSVLPMAASAFVIVYLATRFRSIWKAVGLFLLILSLPGVVKYNEYFWHADALNLFFIVLTLYFLDRDRLRFGRNFYLAAAACGLSAGTRLFGFFFFLTVGGYMLAGLIRHGLTWKAVLGRGLAFVMVMAAVILISNPFLLHSQARARMLEIQQQKSQEIAYGYTDKPDPRHEYRPGWDAWWPMFTRMYAISPVFVFLGVSLVLGALRGGQKIYHRLLLGWLLVVTLYIVYFVSVKSFQYLLPMMIPLYGALYGLPDFLENLNVRMLSTRIRQAAWGLVILAGVAQLVMSVRIIPGL